MPIELTWLGHACWLITTGKYTILVDPFLDDSPTAPIKSDAVKPNFILVTHAHSDHLADAAKIAKREKCTVVAPVETGTWLGKQGVKDVVAMNLGGKTKLPFGEVKMTIAHHSSSLPDGSYGGNPAGYVLTIDGKKIYIAGDTGLFLDMQLYGRDGLDLAILPIGDFYTMGPEDSVEAIKLLKPQRVAPCHYNTWPPIKQDAKAWADMVLSETSAKPEVVEPGGKIKLQ